MPIDASNPDKFSPFVVPDLADLIGSAFIHDSVVQPLALGLNVEFLLLRVIVVCCGNTGTVESSTRPVEMA